MKNSLIFKNVAFAALFTWFAIWLLNQFAVGLPEILVKIQYIFLGLYLFLMNMYFRKRLYVKEAEIQHLKIKLKNKQ